VGVSKIKISDKKDSEKNISDRCKSENKISAEVKSESKISKPRNPRETSLYMKENRGQMPI
jgi:hypothetical protein